MAKLLILRICACGHETMWCNGEVRLEHGGDACVAIREPISPYPIKPASRIFLQSVVREMPSVRQMSAMVFEGSS